MVLHEEMLHTKNICAPTAFCDRYVNYFKEEKALMIYLFFNAFAIHAFPLMLSSLFMPRQLFGSVKGLVVLQRACA